MIGKAKNPNECPPAGATAEGRCAATEASAGEIYPRTAEGGKAISLPRKKPVETEGQRSATRAAAWPIATPRAGNGLTAASERAFSKCLPLCREA